MNPTIVSLIFALVLSTIPLIAYGDGNSTSNREDWVAKEDPQKVPAEGSDASFDKRLPPAYPGEELKDGDKTIKLWSTTGPVPVADAPEPWRTNHINNRHIDSPGEIGVIIDRRNDELHREEK